MKHRHSHSRAEVRAKHLRIDRVHEHREQEMQAAHDRRKQQPTSTLLRERLEAAMRREPPAHE